MAVEARALGKSYGDVRAVDDLSFTLEPGVVTGFLGPNGSGKSTTMRLMLELDHGDGETLWDGVPLREAPEAAAVVGAHLDARGFHPGRTARNHLRMIGAASGASDARVDEVLDFMGLRDVANTRPKGFSLGMSQRLGLASAILAEPGALLLDEPANGLDPQSIQWLREYLRAYAAGGRTVFVSSHLLNEMQVMADHVIVIAKGRLIADEPMGAFVARSTRNDVLVRTPDAGRLLEALAVAGASAVAEGEQAVAVAGLDARAVGDIAFEAGVRVWELSPRTASLEQAFLELTSGEQEYRLGGSGQESAAAAAAEPGPAAEPKLGEAGR